MSDTEPTTGSAGNPPSPGSAFGFYVPDSLLTNDLEQIRAFAAGTA